MGRVRTGPWPTATVPKYEFACDEPTNSNLEQRQQAYISKSQVDSAISRVLRILLSSHQSAVVHNQLRAKALAGGDNCETRKCVVDLALLTLVEHRMLVRHGYGNFALYTIPQESLHIAQELAYADFPSGQDDEALLSLSFVTAPMATSCGRPASLRRSMSPMNSSRGSNRSSSVQRKVPRLPGVKRGGPDDKETLLPCHIQKRLKPAIETKTNSGGGLTPMSP